jgi:hypothetical protein
MAVDTLEPLLRLARHTQAETSEPATADKGTLVNGDILVVSFHLRLL